MNTKNNVVFGIFKTQSEIEKAVVALKIEGFSVSNISFLMPNDPESNASEDRGAVAGAGAIIGGVTGALIGLGMPEYQAKRYEGFVNNGGLLLSVHANSSKEIGKAKKCLERCKATEITFTGEVTVDWSPYQSTVQN